MRDSAVEDLVSVVVEVDMNLNPSRREDGLAACFEPLVWLEG